MVANYRDGLTVRVSRGTCDRRLRGGGEAIIASPRSRQCVRVCVSRPQFMLKSVDAVRCAWWYQRLSYVQTVLIPARYSIPGKISAEISGSHWIKPQQAVVSAALVYHKHVSAGEIVCSTNLAMYRGRNDVYDPIHVAIEGVSLISSTCTSEVRLSFHQRRMNDRTAPDEGVKIAPPREIWTRPKSGGNGRKSRVMGKRHPETAPSPS